MHGKWRREKKTVEEEKGDETKKKITLERISIFIFITTLHLKTKKNMTLVVVVVVALLFVFYVCDIR